MKLYAIAKWNDLYENNRSRVVTDLRWVPIPNKLDGEHFSAIMNHPDGATIFAGFVLLVEIASRCSPRGTLTRSNGQPHTPGSLALKVRCPAAWFTTALDYLETQTDWLHVTDTSVPRQPPAVVEVSPPSAEPSFGFPSDFESIRNRIAQLYGPARRWSHIEESLLAEIARNANADAEFNLILNYRERMAPADRAKYFPQSVLKLLEKWLELLDRARLAPGPRAAHDQDFEKLVRSVKNL